MILIKLTTISNEHFMLVDGAVIEGFISFGILAIVDSSKRLLNTVKLNCSKVPIPVFPVVV